MKNLRSLLVLGLLTGFMLPVFASASTDAISEAYFTNQNPKLTPQEQAAIALAKKWQANSANGAKPVAGPDGSIRFLFGSQQPSIVCAVLQVCDIELQPGEQVNSIHLGDQARWLIEPAVTGQGANEVQHLIVKPMDVGLETSLVVTTNRRTYHLRLRSHRREFKPRISFTYPEDAMMKWDAIKARNSHAMEIKKSRIMPQTGEYLGDLDFAYKVSGNSVWKPVRVYNDGHKTIIQMPAIMAQTEAPTLLLLRKEGGIFSKAKTDIINYRLQGDRYVVDALFDKAVLIAGVGSDQDRVTITREK